MGTVRGSKVLKKLQIFEGSQYFSPDLNRKRFNYKISKERKKGITSVVELDYLSSNLRIIILRSIT